LPVLEAMLSAGDVQLRNVALGAVSEIGPRAHPLVPRLRMMVQSSGAASVDPQAAHYAVYALAAVGEAAVSALAEALGSSDVVTRLLAAEALGRIGPAAAEAAPALAAALADPRPEVHWAAFDALVAVGAAAVPALADLVQDTSQRDDARHLGLLALGEMGAAAVQAAPVLICLLGEEAWWRPALQALGSMGAAAGPFLMEAMTDPDPFIAWTSAFLLREAGEAAVSAGGERSAGYLFSALAHDDADIRQVAVWGLGVAAAAGAASAEAAVPALIGALGDEARAVRLEAQMALRRQGPAVVPLLAEAFRNPASVLGDPPAAPGGCAPASEVRSRAAETLIGFGRPAAAPLLDALADNDPWVRWRAAWALSTLAPVISSGSDEAARLLEAARRESDPRVRIWLERAGARLGAERREAPPLGRRRSRGLPGAGSRRRAG